jgi:uronate dehydrogenase
MINSQRILVTGSAGRLGRATVKALINRGHFVIGYDRVTTPNLSPEQSITGEIDDAGKLHEAIQGIDVLIHLAATPDDAHFPRREAPDDGDNFLSELVPSNIVGPYHVLECARKASVKRLILASTGQVIDGHLRSGNIPVTQHVLPMPRYLYACTKVFLEALGQVYAKQHKMSILAIRLGWCPRDLRQVEEIRQSHLAQDVYLSPADAGRLFVAGVECQPWAGYQMIYATSKPCNSLQYNLEPAEKLIGYIPEESWPTGATEF